MIRPAFANIPRPPECGLLLHAHWLLLTAFNDLLAERGSGTWQHLSYCDSLLPVGVVLLRFFEGEIFTISPASTDEESRGSRGSLEQSCRSGTFVAFVQKLAAHKRAKLTKKLLEVGHFLQPS